MSANSLVGGGGWQDLFQPEAYLVNNLSDRGPERRARIWYNY